MKLECTRLLMMSTDRLSKNHKTEEDDICRVRIEKNGFLPTNLPDADQFMELSL